VGAAPKHVGRGHSSDNISPNYGTSPTYILKRPHDKLREEADTRAGLGLFGQGAGLGLCGFGARRAFPQDIEKPTFSAR
jgi:hypothetical protein